MVKPEQNRRREWLLILAVCAAVALAPLSFYVAGYFLLGKAEHGYWVNPREPVTHRVFPAKWMTFLFRPVGYIEEKLLCRDVVVCIDEPAPAVDPFADPRFGQPRPWFDFLLDIRQ